MGYGEGIFFQKDAFPVNYRSIYLLVLLAAKYAALFCLRCAGGDLPRTPPKGNDFPLETRNW
jgi:hypothetical protein